MNVSILKMRGMRVGREGPLCRAVAGQGKVCVCVKVGRLWVGWVCLDGHHAWPGVIETLRGTISILKFQTDRPSILSYRVTLLFESILGIRITDVLILASAFVSQR